MWVRSTDAATEEEKGDELTPIDEEIWMVNQARNEILEYRSLPLADIAPARILPHETDRQSIVEGRSRSCRNSTNGKDKSGRNANLDKNSYKVSTLLITSSKQATAHGKMSESRYDLQIRSRYQTLRSISLLTFITTVAAISSLASIIYSFSTRQVEGKGCRMSYMRPSFIKFSDFDTEHTRFASKYSLYLYREGGVDENNKIGGVPVIFVPGNAGSYKQVRPIAAEAANYFYDIVQHEASGTTAGLRNLDFFTVDFNEDITAFHGQTLLDQAEYLNEAIAYILSLYHDPNRSERDSNLPDPTSVIILGHSMGGIVARTMLVMPNYQANSINTIITMSAPHARPPVSFDSEIVKTYQRINKYWREAYSQKWANNNPLWHVTLISIAGGGLDTVVPSDYTSLESLVPDTHGFTVYTSSVPNVWTGMDHQAILWCDQFRKVVIRSLYDIVDVNRPTQTKPRADRMRSFKKWFLTGMENIAEKTLPQEKASYLLTLEDDNNSVLAQGERLVARSFGQNRAPRTYLMPIPPQGTPGGKKFTLLTNRKLEANNSESIEVLFCSIFPLSSGKSTSQFINSMDLYEDSPGSTRLACKNAASDVIALPPSNQESKSPFYLDEEEEVQPFSFLQYDLEDILEHQFVAVVDKSRKYMKSWVIAEFSDNIQSHQIRSVEFQKLLTLGLELKLPAHRPIVTEFQIPALRSSLLAFTLKMGHQSCGSEPRLFSPLLRQYMSEPYESKYFVNFKEGNINLHGVSPYMPPPLKESRAHDGLTFQFWTDPTCNSSIWISLKIDILGSMGKLYMRYRTVFAAFPLLVVALVLRKQFRVYDETGIFMTFFSSLDLCLRQSFPLLLLALTLLSLVFSQMSSSLNQSTPPRFWGWSGNTTTTPMKFTVNDLLIGTQDPFFWFMVPLIGLVCVGVCVVINFITLFIINVMSLVYSWWSTKPAWLRNEERKKIGTAAFVPSTLRRRIITTSILLILVSTVIPYQFAYLVACLVQIATCTKAHRISWDTRFGADQNFYNYAHSILILMLWILPINLPILVVWIHNLAVHWLTPFSSHHNLLSIMPFIILVEALTSGKMVPRITSQISHLTSFFFFCIAIYAAVYGMMYAYMLHYLVNFVAAWLVIIHCAGLNTTWSQVRSSAIIVSESIDHSWKRRKTP
ncbi:Bgt-102 [Blumeria graminis f. sp. tritici]|uniref:GPI inositol-deacylase n=2 Tax=Blumeria graminis f. sp. tritici TaxID=62690 RepID=A0A381L776_BLUGR|nr:GPI inositol deacylase [Blumeria graminis f. sp. tritici 96224]VDB83660.1 Bgt-102 [Blumeria graminis f. sp. tritici]